MASRNCTKMDYSFIHVLELLQIASSQNKSPPHALICGQRGVVEVLLHLSVCGAAAVVSEKITRWIVVQLMVGLRLLFVYELWTFSVSLLFSGRTAADGGWSVNQHPHRGKLRKLVQLLQTFLQTPSINTASISNVSIDSFNILPQLRSFQCTRRKMATTFRTIQKFFRF